MAGTQDVSGRVTRGVMAAQMAKTARDLHVGGGNLLNGIHDLAYTRGQVDLICRAAGLPDRYRWHIEAFIDGEMSDDEFGQMLAKAVFT